MDKFPQLSNSEIPPEDVTTQVLEGMQAEEFVSGFAQLLTRDGTEDAVHMYLDEQNRPHVLLGGTYAERETLDPTQSVFAPEIPDAGTQVLRAHKHPQVTLDLSPQDVRYSAAKASALDKGGLYRTMIVPTFNIITVPRLEKIMYWPLTHKHIHKLAATEMKYFIEATQNITYKEEIAFLKELATFGLNIQVVDFGKNPYKTITNILSKQKYHRLRKMTSI